VAGKYTPLENYLLKLPENKTELTLRFDQLEKILQSRLPASAYEDRRWWDHEKEANHINPRAWTKAGWHIAGLDVPGKRVKFIRS